MTHQSRQGSANQSPSPEALIALVQDLNQRNHELLDRIATLEKSLQSCQPAAQPTGQPSAIAPPPPGENAVQEQVDYLLNQLEFAQQTAQRQDIRIQTLSEQLNASQERLKGLEQENARLQSLDSQQAYQLNQLNDECRDLRVRLQRQQRYTLQFKAALEKCLEVPPPSYGSLPTDGLIKPSPSVSAEASEEPAPIVETLMPPLFPRASIIKPWSSQLDGGAVQSQAEGVPIAAPSPTAANAPAASWAGGASVNCSPRFQSRLMELAHQPLPDQGDTRTSAESAGAIAPPSPAQSSPPSSPAELPAPPLAPASEPNPNPSSADVVHPEPPGPGPESPSDTSGSGAEPSFAIHNPFQPSAAAAASAQPESEASTPAPSDEDSLWRDLARLVDASIDDIVASQRAEEPLPVPPQVVSQEPPQQDCQAPFEAGSAPSDEAIANSSPWKASSSPDTPGESPISTPQGSAGEIALTDLLRSGVLQPVKISPSWGLEPLPSASTPSDGEPVKPARKPLDLPRVASVAVPSTVDGAAPGDPASTPEEAEACPPDRSTPAEAAAIPPQSSPKASSGPSGAQKKPVDWPSPTLDAGRGYKKAGVVDLPAFLRG